MASSTVPNVLKTSFFLHSKEEKQNIISLHEQAVLKPNEFLLDTQKLAKQRAVFSSQSTYYKQQLATTNPASFAFLSDAQKKRLEQQLLFTFYLLYAQYQLDTVEERKYTLKEHQKQMDLCTKNIEKLRNSAVCGAEVPFEKDLQDAINQSDKSLQLLGLTVLARWFMAKIRQISDNKTGMLNDWLTEINGLRLYWVWGGGMLAAVLAIWPDDLFNKLQTKQGLATIAPITGYMSWLLYYTRFGINLFLLAKHTLGPSFFESEESKIPMWERFKTQWNQRKFALLNDSIWGFANMVCFFWLTGSGLLGYAGNIVTVGLLLMDFVLTTWRFWEEWTKHNKEMLTFERDREALLAQKASLKNEDYEAQLTHLNKMEAKAKFDWKYKQYGLINDWMYALGLMLAFSMMCCFFLPAGILVPATVMIIGLTGAVTCFVLNLTYAAISSGIAIAKTKRTDNLVRLEAKELLDKFNTLGEKDGLVKRQLYLEIKGLMMDSDYQKRLVRFQAIKMARSILVDAVVPFVFFAALMFMPLGIGLGVLAASVAVIVISTIIINRFEPQPEQLPEFNQWEYVAFELNPKLEHFEEKKKVDSRFFGKDAPDLVPSLGYAEESVPVVSNFVDI